MKKQRERRKGEEEGSLMSTFNEANFSPFAPGDFAEKRKLKLQPVAKMMRHSHGKTTFLASNRSWSQVCKI